MKKPLLNLSSIHFSFTGLCIAGMFLLNASLTMAQQLAFPTAEGFGRYASGGRGGTVYHVTNLNDAGTGSLRDAVSQSNRTVVFDVGGVINVASRIVVSSGVTIAGQTAPGGGITIYGDGVACNAGNNIIRYIRIRMGKNGTSGKDALSIASGQNFIFDHVSISWGRDGTLDVNGSGIDNLTFQDCIVSQGINNSNHSTGGLLQSGKWSMIRSLYIDNKTRNPKARGTHEFINSVLYNWAEHGYIMGDTEGLSECNLIGNYFIYGPSSNGNSHITNTTPTFNVYASDNWVDADKDGVLDGTLLTDYKTATVKSTPYSYPGVSNLMSAQAALNYIIANVGASITRDAVDNLLISQLTSYGTSGQIINTEDDNGIPGNVGTVANGTPAADADQDGMPNAWETANGLNPNDAADRNNIGAGGYTMLEIYINSLVGGGGSGSGNINPYTTVQAENYSSMSGVQTETCSEGGLNVGYIENGDWIRFSGVDFGTGATGVSVRVASNATGGTIKFRLDAAGGPQIGAINVTSSGGWQTWTTMTASVSGASGVHDLYLSFSGGTGYLLNLNHFVFTGGSAALVANAPVLKNSSESNIQVYPNPTVDLLHVHVSKKRVANAGILIYDNVGRQVLSSGLTGNQTTVNVAGLSPGLYILQLSNGREIITKKFLKR
ncbi:Por secretion system C-terminal sorting domain-containing protein [Filimonas lacunae]|uniref:Por secretion system C-terminal sorting domain-containing protein n=1 Tax=Filimonas lacunae TaxID=477680 RepID=A0A173MMR4_9BACT|nr:carbohydrate-binding protein [Filimonas lacunae]BAV08943.1 pectate lyase [Filimonas lacunae]SIS64434.1 Por secretion system C-terminal sorting domain-containing protein [Filimonas lacunae]